MSLEEDLHENGHGPTPSQRTITIPRTSEVFVIEKRALKRFWLRYLGWGSLIFYAILLGVFIWSSLVDGELWIRILLAVVVAFGPLWAIIGYYGWMREFTRGEEAGRSLVLEVVFSTSGITFRAGGESRVLAWDSFYYLWQFPDCWILVREMYHFIPIPTKLLDEETKKLIFKGMSGFQGKVRDNPGLGLGLIFGARYG